MGLESRKQVLRNILDKKCPAAPALLGTKVG
jgi:hypothetical protein